MKSTTSFLIGFFVQNGYFRDKDGGRSDEIPSKYIKSERKERDNGKGKETS